MRQCLNVLVVLSVFMGLLAGTTPASALAVDTMPGAPSTLAITSASVPDSVLPPISMVDSSPDLHALLPVVSNPSQFWLWRPWWCRWWPWSPWCRWWPWPWPWPWWWF